MLIILCVRQRLVRDSCTRLFACLLTRWVFSLYLPRVVIFVWPEGLMCLYWVLWYHALCICDICNITLCILRSDRRVQPELWDWRVLTETHDWRVYTEPWDAYVMCVVFGELTKFHAYRVMCYVFQVLLRIPRRHRLDCTHLLETMCDNPNFIPSQYSI